MSKRVFLTGKMAAFITAMVMSAVVLGGCGKSSAAKTPAAEDDAFNFASVKDVKFPLKKKLEFTVFVYATATGGGTYQNNYVTDWIEKKTNIHLNYVYDLDGDDAKTKLNLVMTGSTFVWTAGASYSVEYISERCPRLEQTERKKPYPEG